MKVLIRGFHEAGDMLVTVPPGKNSSLSDTWAAADADDILDFLERVVPRNTVRHLIKKLTDPDERVRRAFGLQKKGSI